MGLRAFHIFFITISVIFAFFFGGWCIHHAQSDISNKTLSFVVAGFSFIAGIGLIVYGRYFMKKTKNI